MGWLLSDSPDTYVPCGLVNIVKDAKITDSKFPNRRLKIE